MIINTMAMVFVLHLCLLFFSTGLADQGRGIPSHAAKFTSNILAGTLKGTKKAGYYLVQPKHVEVEQVYGLWRLDLDDGGILNLEVTPKHVVLVDPRKQERLVLPYEFKPAKWQMRARIEFQTKNVAYQVVIHRKVLASNVLKLKGTIRQLGRWGSKRAVGHTFRGKRRLKAKVDSSEDEEHASDDESEVDTERVLDDDDSELDSVMDANDDDYSQDIDEIDGEPETGESDADNIDL